MRDGTSYTGLRQIPSKYARNDHQIVIIYRFLILLTINRGIFMCLADIL